MTANALAWTVTATVWAGILALAGIWVLNRVFARYHSHGRTPAQEPPHRPPATAAAARSLLLRMVPGPLRDRTPQHEGATKRYGAELRALRDLPPAPELTTAGEQMVADHAALDGISQAITHFDALIEAELDRFLAGMPRERIRLTASVEATGEMPVLAVTG